MGRMTHRFDKFLKANHSSVYAASERSMERTSLTRLPCPRQLDRLLGVVKVSWIEYAIGMKGHG